MKNTLFLLLIVLNTSFSCNATEADFSSLDPRPSQRSGWETIEVKIGTNSFFIPRAKEIALSEDDWNEIKDTHNHPVYTKKTMFSYQSYIFNRTVDSVYENKEIREYYENYNHVGSVNHSQSTWGLLSLPDGNEPCPGVVILHGSDGAFSDIYDFYMNALKEQGIASFNFNRFSLNNKTTTIENQLTLTQENETMMAFSAGRLLASHPRLKGQKIAVMGFSRGGTVALNCADPYHIKACSPYFTFDAHVIYYAMPLIQKCFQPNAPVAFFHGMEDTYTPLNIMKKYIEYLPIENFLHNPEITRSHTYTLESYKTQKHEAYFYSNSGHGFDHALGVKFSWAFVLSNFLDSFLYKDPSIKSVPNAQNLSRACVKLSDSGDHFTPLDANDAQEKPLERLLPFLKKHAYQGADLKINAPAAHNALENALVFLQKHLSLSLERQ